ncbi:hypothetical protein C8A01DRAFT_39039 [Parachaetomium inaequale]|uniref:Uncharacterized protein n=1 Tax=Parachaetomium inaequale TaxID=2588326 RepID=A0AAN6P9Z9_9PEZI|nr:hypothetical protein C8A01DRAFT_39039 [Parachaetomium inaequale]
MKHATALAAVIGVASASAIPPFRTGDPICSGTFEACSPRGAKGDGFGDPRYEDAFLIGGPTIAKRNPSPRGGRGGGGAKPGPGSPPPSSGGGGSSTGKDVAVEVGSGIITEGFGVGLDALVNGQPAPPAPPQKRDPRGGRPGGGAKPGPASPPPSPGGGGGGSNTGKDFALGVGEGILVEGAGVGLDALVNGQPAPPAPPQKRDPRGGRPGGGAKPGPASPPPSPGGGGGGSNTAKDLALGVGEGILVEGAGVGLDALVNGQQPPPPPAQPAPAPQKRDPRRGGGGGGGPKPGPGSPPQSPGGGSSTGKDIAVEVGSGIITEGFGVGLDALVNGQPAPAPSAPQKRDPRGGRPGGGAKPGPGSPPPSGGGGSSTGKDIAVEVGSVNGQPAPAPSAPQKRDPRGSRPSGGAKPGPGSPPPSGGGGSSTGKDFAVEAGSGIITEGFGVGLDALVNGQPAPASPAPQKRAPIVGALVRLIPGLIDAGTAAADAASQKRSEDAVEARADSKGKALGKKLGSAIADSDKESGASAAMGRPGMAGYLTAGLAVAVVVFGLNAL